MCLLFFFIQRKVASVYEALETGGFRPSKEYVIFFVCRCVPANQGNNVKKEQWLIVCIFEIIILVGGTTLSAFSRQINGISCYIQVHICFQL